MIAVRSPMMTSPNALASAFSPYTDSPSSDGQNSTARKSPAPTNASAGDKSKHLSTISSATAPAVLIAVNPQGPPQNTDFVDPSPIAPSSNGTEFTDMDVGTEEEKNEEPLKPITKPLVLPKSPPAAVHPPLTIRTDSSRTQIYNPRSTYEDYGDEPQSVIHAPPGFRDFIAAPLPTTAPPTSSQAPRSPPTAAPTPAPASQAGKQPSDEKAAQTPPERERHTSPSQRSDTTVRSPLYPENLNTMKRGAGNSPVSPPALTTAALSRADWKDRPTPQAQTRQEAEAYQRPRSGNLEGIPEGHDNETHTREDGDATPSDNISQIYDIEAEISALKTALSECWVLCNTLANLNSISRGRSSTSFGKGDTQEQAWRTCWILCKRLYESRDEENATQLRPTLDLCRDFCQALFEVRVRDHENEAADSILRVSFELNNHLYNTHDRTLPEAFGERTLDFYITLCHRLMKQRTRLPAHTDALLRACWELAEMLFNLRQNKREGQKLDAELLGSAVQACWDLCDLFREGWKQIRPERATPRPSQITFTQVYQQVKKSGDQHHPDENSGVPETPTTIFEDTVTGSPDEAPGPNILVFGQVEGSRTSRAAAAGTQARQDRHATPSPHKMGRSPPRDPGSAIAEGHNSRLSSKSSTDSTQSNSTHTASSSSTITTLSRASTAIPAATTEEDPNLVLLKMLFIRAAQTHGGFERSGSASLPASVKSLPHTAFGTQQWQITLLESYKKVVVGDPAFRNVGRPARASASDVARAVDQMVRSGHYGWLRDLFKLVFGFSIDEAPSKKGIMIQT